MAERFIFPRPLGVFEVRKPLSDIARDVASEVELFAHLEQRQQPALSGSPGSRGRQRVGNGKHKNWFIQFQAEPLSFPRPTIVGTLAVKTEYDPGRNQFGGFHYTNYDEPDPTYRHITILTAVEMGTWRGKAPSEEITEEYYSRLHQHFGTQGELVDPADYITDLFPLPDLTK